MFKVELKTGPQIDVASRKHSFNYATNGSLPNPLEAFYASLAGCAGVYAKKACHELGIPDEGIVINLRAVANTSNPMVPDKIVTSVSFPEQIDANARTAILDAISHCAVKEVVKQGAGIQFSAIEGSSLK